MKKFILIALLLLTPIGVMAQGVPGKRMLMKEQTVHTLTTTAQNVTRNVSGYVAILTPSSVLMNAARATDNFFTLDSPGIDLEAFYNNQQKIYMKTSSGTVTVNVLVYDYE